ncbi:MAG: hypothetical protein JO182_10825 [Acidobacteriaceae bacterium]|nr:hypothetical protein [Acidobacteriaceae bacterium]MBV9677062.1 hypothetical protein [Acidobacteriaceae bacterium]
MDQPNTLPCFYVVTNNVLLGIWEAREADLTELLRTHPGYSVVQSYVSRQEAEAYIRKIRDRKL